MLHTLESPSLHADSRAERVISRRAQVALLAALVLLGLGVRLYQLDAPGVLIDREFTSAVFARDFYFDRTESVEPWRKNLARLMRQKQPTLEPPVTEWVVSLGYQLAGGERLWIAHVVASVFWVVGAVFLYAWLVELVSVEAALVGAAVYLLDPFAVLVSRSFQPDSLMMLLFLCGLYGIARYWRSPSLRLLLSVAAVAGGVIVYRPLVLFALVGAFVAPAVQRFGPLKGLLHRRALLFLTISVVPAVAYYGYGTFVGGYFGWKLETSFRPWLLGEREFWMGWFSLAIDAVSYPAALGALLGFPLLRRTLPRWTCLGLAAGYVAFGLLFTMHVHTHGYYHAQLIPIAALTAGPLVTVIIGHLREAADRRWTWTAAAALVLLMAVVGARELRGELGRQRYESPTVARQIGNLVNHSSRVVFLAPYYGMPLQYYGEFTGAYWPRRLTYYLKRRGEPELTIDERLSNLGFSPEYFVITALGEFERHHEDLQEYLARDWQVLAETHDYRIYRRPEVSDARHAQNDGS